MLSNNLVFSLMTFTAGNVLFLHSTTSGSPVEIIPQHDDILGKIADVRGEIEEIYKRLNKLTGPPNDVTDDSHVQSYKYYPTNNVWLTDRLCLTKECIAASHKLFQNMNVSVDPCDDFYQFSCGNYIHRSIIPDDKGMLSSSFSPLRNKSRLWTLGPCYCYFKRVYCIHCIIL